MSEALQKRPRVAIGSNPERNRAHNRRVVLEVIRLHGHLGRTEIARNAKLTPQAVANIVEELLDEGMLVQLGRLRSGRGQPPIQFAVNPDGPLTIGVEIAADHVVCAVIDLSGKVRGHREIALEDTTPNYVQACVSSEIKALQAELEIENSRILGLGIVMPGPFSIEGMSSVGPATLKGWSGVDPVALFKKATGFDVSLDNDATAAAVGERLYGGARQIDNYCYIYFGVGLGLGIIQNGRPLRGNFGNAGEIGHIVITPRNRPALYGIEGALENFASLHALREKLGAEKHKNLSIESLTKLFEQNDSIVLEWIKEAADYLAPTIATIENLFDPQTIIMGGHLPDVIFDALIAALDPLPVSVSIRNERSMPRVMRAETGQMTAVLGAGSLPLLDEVSPHLSIS